MILRHLLVRRFRGIRELDWAPGGVTLCLIGPGDSTKSTIITAVEWALLSRWSLSVSDTDFHGAITNEPIVIEATVGALPRALLGDQKFGLDVRGWSDGQLHDEPRDGDEPVLTIRLTIDDSLEPRWDVVNDRQSEPHQISARDREALGATRLGLDVERHLTWGRGSGLLRLTSSTEEAGRTLAAAYRAARGVVNSAGLADLVSAAARASELARAAGAGATEPYRPGLDAAAIGSGASALGLHEGEVPVRAAGLGSRRLVALAIQRASFADGGILVIDEIETGLEPHRLRHLLRELRVGESGQVLMTTHSEIPIVELRSSELRVVSSTGGTTTIRTVPDGLQAAVRRAPDALLGRRLIVCEGKTEVGLCRALDPLWATSRGSPPAHVGVVLVPGGGSRAAQTALEFASLGYSVALLVDSDVPIQPTQAELAGGGVSLFSWDDGVCTEERVMRDVPWTVFLAIIDRAAALLVEDAPQAVTDAIAAILGEEAGTNTGDWLASGRTGDQIRSAAGHAAKKGGWFKRTDLGEALGELIVSALPENQDSDLAKKLNALADWAYAP